jgi:hypothetical protein
MQTLYVSIQNRSILGSKWTSAQNAGTKMTVIGKTEYRGNSYGWGNLYQKNVTKCSAENLQVSVTAENPLTGY